MLESFKVFRSLDELGEESTSKTLLLGNNIGISATYETRFVANIWHNKASEKGTPACEH